MGELLGVTKGMVSQWESNLVTIPLDRLIELSKHVDFSFDWLIKDRPGIALEIEHSLTTIHQRNAWYRVGHALAEPTEGTNNK